MKKQDKIKINQLCGKVKSQIPFVANFVTEFSVNSSNIKDGYTYSDFYKGYVDDELVKNALKART